MITRSRGPNLIKGLSYPFRKIISEEYRDEKVLDEYDVWTGKTKKVLFHVLECGHVVEGSEQHGAGSRKTRRCKQCPGVVDRLDPEGKGIR